MMDQFILFADTNVFLDAFLKRDAGKNCKEIFMMAENSQVEIFTSPTCLMTMIYFLQKAGMPIKAVKEIVEEGIDFFITSNIKDFKNSFSILPVLTPSQFLGVHS